MKRNLLTWMTILLVLFLGFSFLGCEEGDGKGSAVEDDVNDDDDDDDNDDDDSEDGCDEQTHDPLIIKGKASLSDQDPFSAFAFFEDAKAACLESEDARAGMLIAKTQELFFWINNAFNTSKSVDAGFGPALQQKIKEELLPLTGTIFSLSDDLVENHNGARFFVDPLPMFYMEDHLLLEMGGEWDIHDFANAKALARIARGVGKILLALNINFDDELFANNPVPEGSDIFDIIHHYCDLLLEMYDDPEYDDFLTLNNGGKKIMADGGIQLGLGLVKMNQNFYAMRTETDAQEDDVAGYVDTNQNGVWDEGEPFRTPYFDDASPEMNVTIMDILTLIEALGMAILDGGPEDIHPAMPDWFNLDTLNFILEYTDILDPDNPIRLPSISIPLGWLFYNVGNNGWRLIGELLTEFLADFEISF